MHLKKKKYLEVFLKISYRDAFGYQGMYSVFFPNDKVYIEAISDYQYIIIFMNANKKGKITKIARNCKLFVELLYQKKYIFKKLYKCLYNTGEIDRLKWWCSK